MEYFSDITGSNITIPDNNLLPQIMMMYCWYTALISSTIISFLLFPIFQFVHRKNMETDQLTPIYPIIKHFNFVVKITLFSLLYSIFGSLATSYREKCQCLQGVPAILSSIFSAGAVICIFLICFTPQVQYILHFLLGLQRFCIYFYPASEKYVILSEKRLKILLGALYSMFLAHELWSLYMAGRNLLGMNTEYFSTAASIHFYIFLGLNILQLIGASFYIPILANVSKLTHLASASINKPQRYIMFQIITHLISRIAFLPCGYFFFRVHKVVGLLIATLLDIFLTPLTIQLSYLLCNKKNVKTLFSSSPKVIIKSLIFPNYRTAQVHSEVVQSTKY